MAREGVQRHAPCREGWRARALQASRPAALGSGPPSSPALGRHGRPRANPYALRVAPRLQTGREAERGRQRWTVAPALHAHSGTRAAYEWAKREKDSKLHLATGTVSHRWRFR
jgi:hypothetical protein